MLKLLPWVLASLLFSPESHATFSFRFAGTSSPAIEKFLREVESRMPARMKAVIAEPVALRFEALDQTTSLKMICPKKGADSADHDHQRRIVGKLETSRFTNLPSRPYSISLHKHLRAVIEAGEGRAATYPCGHGNTYKLALASVLHEMAHIFDFSENLLTERDRYDQATCGGEREASNGLSPKCARLGAMLGKISDRLHFQNLTGFAVGKSQNKNRNVVVSADAYEYAAPKEFLAVNTEYFLLDDSFACRKPAVAQYLAAIYQHKPAARCQPVQYVIGSNSGIQVNLDPARAYQVHYLFASKGQAAMSKWGHAMLRVVMCAPSRLEVGPECMKDVAYHVVVSFRANIEGPLLNYVDGITGKYPSQLLISSMSEVVDEYNRREMRDLFSLPLNLTKGQKELLIKRTLEQFWGYAGKYYFLSNNCATETDQLIKGAISEYHPYQETSAKVLTPLDIFNDLQRHKLANGSVVKNREKAIAEGYLFPNQREALERSFTAVKKSKANKYPTLDEFLEKSGAEERKFYFESIEPTATNAAAFYLLEKSVQRQMEARLQSNAVERATAKEKGKMASADQAAINQALDEIAKSRDSMLPWNLVLSDRSYGVPTVGEVATREDYVGRLRGFLTAMQKLGDLTDKTLSEGAKEVQRSKENQKVFAAAMRAARAE